MGASIQGDGARGLPVTLSRDELRAIRSKQFGQFSESVEVGLQNYQGMAGVRSLFSVPRSRYGTTAAAKVQLALLFSLILAGGGNQPSDLIRRALAQADGASVRAVEIVRGGNGYSGSTPPRVSISAPDAGEAAAVVRAELAATGALASITLKSGGGGYQHAPVVGISPPVAGGTPAEAVARVDAGRVVSVELTSRGSTISARCR